MKLPPPPPSLDPLRLLLQQSGGCSVIDGGLGTQLHLLGANVNHPLWSARCLITEPHLVKQVHREYLEAGAEVIITASYQATLQGFQSTGLSLEEGEWLLKRSVELAREARDDFWDECQNPSWDGSGSRSNRRRALVAASVGSYGAYLADGSEYNGDYGPDMTLQKLKDFHRRRVQVLAEAGPDLMAFETIPSKLEAQAYIELLQEEEIGIPSWMCFNSKDGVNVVRGDSFEECVLLAHQCPKVVAVGVNCTPPRFIHGLILSAQKVTTKPIVVYPNTGDSWDAEKKEWVPSSGVSDVDFVSYVHKWREAGAALIGGCCQTTPNTIHAISKYLQTTLSSHSKKWHPVS